MLKAAGISVAMGNAYGGIEKRLHLADKRS